MEAIKKEKLKKLEISGWRMLLLKGSVAALVAFILDNLFGVIGW